VRPVADRVGEQSFVLPVAQGGGANTERAGEFGDGHGVVGAGVVDRFGGDGRERVLGEQDSLSFVVQSCVRRIESAEQVWERRPVRGAQDVLAWTGPTPALSAT